MTDTVRVPREPTEAMRYAGDRAVANAMHKGGSIADLAKLDGETMDLAASPQGEGDWIKHDGGPNPVPGKMVDARTSGWPATAKNVASDDLHWEHTGGAFDIIAYRVTEGVK